MKRQVTLVSTVIEKYAQNASEKENRSSKYGVSSIVLLQAVFHRNSYLMFVSFSAVLPACALLVLSYWLSSAQGRQFG